MKYMNQQKKYGARVGPRTRQNYNPIIDKNQPVILNRRIAPPVRGLIKKVKTSVKKKTGLRGRI